MHRPILLYVFLALVVVAWIPRQIHLIGHLGQPDFDARGAAIFSSVFFPLAYGFGGWLAWQGRLAGYGLVAFASVGNAIQYLAFDSPWGSDPYHFAATAAISGPAAIATIVLAAWLARPST